MNKDEHGIMENGRVIEMMEHAAAKKEFKAMGLGYRYLVAQSGVAIGSIYKYMSGNMKPGVVRNRIHDALCRVLKIDEIIYPGE